MRAKNDFQKKTKNSFIFFQLGLIATMLVVLFILEFNFKDSNSIIGRYEPKVIDITEIAYTYNPEVIKKNDVKPITKVVEKITPKIVVPKILNDFDLKDDEIEVKKQNLATQDDANKKDVAVDDNPNPYTTAGKNDRPVTPPDINTVEQLPMFRECRGLSRSEQKACFDEQLSKVISRNLVYPEDDFENRKQGRAVIEFIIDEKGNITNVKTLNDKGATVEMKKAAEKAVKKIPQLIPAKQGENNVRIKYAIPISFRIN